MSTVTEFDCESGETSERPLTPAEQQQRDQDSAEGAARQQAADKARAERTALADKARGGTLTPADTQRAIAMLLAR